MKAAAALAVFFLLATISAQADDRLPRRAEVIAMIEAEAFQAVDPEAGYAQEEIERLVFDILPIILHDGRQTAAIPLVRLAIHAVDNMPDFAIDHGANILIRVEVETALAGSQAALGEEDLAFRRLAGLEESLASLVPNPEIHLTDLADAYERLISGAIEAGDIPLARRAAEAGLLLTRDSEDDWMLLPFIRALSELGMSLRASWEGEQLALRLEALDRPPDDEAWFDLAAIAAVTEGPAGQTAAIAWAEQAVESPDWRGGFYEGLAARLVSVGRLAEARPFLLQALKLELEDTGGYRHTWRLNHLAALAARAGACDLALPTARLAETWARIGELEAALGDESRAGFRQSKSHRQSVDDVADDEEVVIYVGSAPVPGRTEEANRLRVGLYCGAVDEFAREYLAHYAAEPRWLQLAARAFGALESEGGADIRRVQRAAIGRALPASGLLTLPPTENAWERAGRLSFLAYAALALHEAGDYAAADRALRNAWALLAPAGEHGRLDSLAWLALAARE